MQSAQECDATKLKTEKKPGKKINVHN